MSEDQVKALLAELENRQDKPGQEDRVEQIKNELKELGHRAGSVSNGPSSKVEKAVNK